MFKALELVGSYTRIGMDVEYSIAEMQPQQKCPIYGCHVYYRDLHVAFPQTIPYTQ